MVSLRSFAARMERVVPLPRLSYGLGRTIRWPWLPYVAYGFMMVVLAVLIPLNFALQGYQVISVYSQSPNTTNTHWYNKFSPSPTPGTECDPHVFTVGDTLATTMNLFSYTLATVRNAADLDLGTNSNSAPYNAMSLEWCDVDTVQITADLRSQSAVVSAEVKCYNPDFEATAYTSVSAGFASDAAFRSGASDMLDYNPITYITFAGMDLLSQMQNISNANASAPVLFSLLGNVEVACPYVAYANPDAWNASIYTYGNSDQCTEQNYTDPASLGPPNDSESFPWGGEVYQDLMANVANNFMQAMLATVRYDLGNFLPNSYLNSTSWVLSNNQTLFPPFTQVAANGTFFSSPDQPGLFIPGVANALEEDNLPLGLPSNNIYIQTEYPHFVASYLCHLTVEKSPASAFISVVVATLSIGGTIWGLVLAVATFFAKRNEANANYCEYHEIERGGPDDHEGSYEAIEAEKISHSADPVVGTRRSLEV